MRDMATLTAIRRQRQLHVVDVENLLGGTYFAPADVRRLRVDYSIATAMGATCQVVVAASADEPAMACGLGWPEAGLRLHRGPDGADLALLDVLLNEDVANRFQRIYIGSGDGIFAPVAAGLARRGVEVTVVSRRASLSVALRLSASRVIYLEVPEAMGARARHGRAA